MSFINFKLEKLTLKAFKDEARKVPIPKPHTLRAMFNPETLKEALCIHWEEKQAMGSSGRTASFQHKKPQTLNVTLLLDATGANEMRLPFQKPTPILRQIQLFKALTSGYNGDLHQPNFLLLEWGPLSLPCRLSHHTVTYKLFDRTGTPIRAEIEARFIEDESQETLAKKENKSSPDLTHSRTIRHGDTLPLLTREIYGASTHYLRVARFNDLDHPSALPAGRTIYFPPLERLLSSQQTVSQ